MVVLTYVDKTETNFDGSGAEPKVICLSYEIDENKHV